MFRAPFLFSQKILRPGPYRPNVPICRYGCRVVPASGLARSWGWRSEPLDLSPPIFYVFPCAAWGASGAGSGRPLLLPYWTRSTPSFAPPGGVRGAGAGRPGLLLLPYWTRSTPSFAPPGGVRGAGAGRLLPLPYWMRSTTPPPILPPTSGLARRRWRRGAQLDGELAFYGSRRRLRALPGGGGGGALSWTGGLLSLPLAANFGPGPEGAAEGCAGGREVCFLRFSQSTSGLARRGRRRGSLRNGESAFHRLWESPTASARRQWRRGIWTKSLHPCSSSQ